MSALFCKRGELNVSVSVATCMKSISRQLKTNRYDADVLQEGTCFSLRFKKHLGEGAVGTLPVSQRAFVSEAGCMDDFR